MDCDYISKIVGILPDYIFAPLLYIIRYYFYKKLLGFKTSSLFYIFVSLLLILFDFSTIGLFSKVLSEIISLLLLLFTVQILCKGTIILKFYAVILENTVLVLLNLFILPIDNWISPTINNIDMSFNMHMIINLIHICSIYIFCFACLYVILMKISQMLNLKDKFITIIQSLYLFIPCLSSYGLSAFIYYIQEIDINNTLYYLPNIAPNGYGYILSVVSFLLLISIPMVAYSFKNMIETDEQKRKTMLIEQQFSHQLNHIKNIDNIYLGINRVIHDMNNHISCLKILADNNNLKELKKYLGKISETVSKLDFRIKTGNPICDAVINEKYNISQLEGINFMCNLTIPPKNNIESIDLCVLLSNALDNSIEACRKIIDSENIDRKISITSYVRGMYFIIEVSNSNIEKLNYINGEVVTSKPDKFNHGIGISNIQDIVKKYNGAFDIMEEKNEVTISLMLKYLNNN